MNKEDKSIAKLQELLPYKNGNIRDKAMVRSLLIALKECGWSTLKNIPNVKGFKIKCLTEEGFIVDRIVKRDVNGNHYIDDYDKMIGFKVKY